MPAQTTTAAPAVDAASQGGAAPVRAESPPAQYWRRWAADAGAPLAVGIEPAPEVVAPVATPGPDDASEARYRVLVVEDDMSQALFAESVLSGAGMEAAVVGVAGEVMGALERFEPDLVLMDLHMPGMDGAELTGMIRGHPIFGLTPIVFLTGETDPERQFEVLEIGADDFLSKPVRPRHLVAAVQNRVKRARLQKQLRSDGRHPSTGLHTRTRMLQALNAAIPGDGRGALYFIEVEGSSALRDRFGYSGLEAILTDAGRHLGSLAEEAAVSRLSDNIFLVYAPEVPASALEDRARRLRDGIGRHAFEIHGETIRLRTLVGYAALDAGFADAGSALAAAEGALRDARTLPTGISAYVPPVATAPGDRVVGAIRDALDSGRVELAFQPIVAVAGGEDAQFQTLLRMRDAGGALLTAAEVIPAAEAANLLHEVDARVLELAAAALRERVAQGHPVRLFVSQAARSLAREDHVARLVALASEDGIDGASLVIDVRQDDAVIHALALREFGAAMLPTGIQLCLGQYQSGTESDALLAQLPLGFVRLTSLYSTRLDDPLVRDEMRGAIERAHRAGLQVIGQHVEDPQAAATLWMSGVDFIQGNLVQRAAGALDFDFQHSVL